MLLEVVRVGDETDGTSLRLNYGTLSVYFDGNGVETHLGQSTEADDLASLPNAPATVLRVGRHDDAKAASPDLLDALSPSFAIISVGATARGTAPSDDKLMRLNDAGATVYRTDQNGSIRLTSDGERVWLVTGK